MLEQGSLEHRVRGELPLLPRCAGGDAREELLARGGDFPVPRVWQWVICVGSPPSQQLRDLQQEPHFLQPKEMETPVEEGLMVLQG